MITKEILQDLFEYKDGNLYRKKASGGESKGSICGWITTCNLKKYKKLSVNKKTIYLHHAIFLLHHGYLPKIIDHKDGDSLNNDINNLRPCDQSLNTANSGKRSTNTSGYKGVTFRKDTKKWQSQIMVNYKHISLGSYETPEEAHKAYIQGCNKYFGEFARHE